MQAQTLRPTIRNGRIKVNRRPFDVTVTAQASEPDRRNPRDRRGRKPRVYVGVDDENIAENLLNRHDRPIKIYRKIAVQALRDIGLIVGGPKQQTPDGHGAVSLRWSQKAGCTCPCSPGFIATNLVAHDGRNLDIHITITGQGGRSVLRDTEPTVDRMTDPARMNASTADQQDFPTLDTHEIGEVLADMARRSEAMIADLDRLDRGSSDKQLAAELIRQNKLVHTIALRLSIIRESSYDAVVASLRANPDSLSDQDLDAITGRAMPDKLANSDIDLLAPHREEADATTA